MERPTYLLFAGVNGAGKSTFYRSYSWLEPGLDRRMRRVNPDELVRAWGGDYHSDADQIRAGREALKLIRRNFDQRISFNQETTLSGKLALKNIRKARELGYRIVMYYLGIDTPETSLARISHRVEIGGHPIDETAVRRRSQCVTAQSIPCARSVRQDHRHRQYHRVCHRRAVDWRHFSWVGNIAKHAPWLLEAIRDNTIWHV